MPMGSSGRVSKAEFKAKALEYLRRVESTGEELVVTDRGEPVVRILPVRMPEPDARARLLGSLVRYDDPTLPVATEDWEALK
jgi:prevent-host-death family protein